LAPGWRAFLLADEEHGGPPEVAVYCYLCAREFG
jgi:hypothetical protein